MASRRCNVRWTSIKISHAVHLWMLLEKSWTCLHVDNSINVMGMKTGWWSLILSYVIHEFTETLSTFTRDTLNLMEGEDFTHSGYPHTQYNASTFLSEEFQRWCKERGISYLTGATNGAAENLALTFKQELRKSSLPPDRALQEFLRCSTREFSPSEFLIFPKDKV